MMPSPRTSTPVAPLPEPYTSTPVPPPAGPVAREFDIGPEQLIAASARLQATVGLTLDNFTPNEYQYCQPAAPGDCPAPGADPETYKFFAKDASVFVINGRRYPFSLVPTRAEPFTFYLDQMSTTLMQFRVEANELVLAISFEGNGTEIRSNCIRNASCAFAGSQDRDFPQPLLNLRFGLRAIDGRLDIVSARAEFKTGAATEDAQLASYVVQAVETTLLQEQIFRAFVNSALNAAVLRFAEPQHCALKSVVIAAGLLRLSSLCQAN